jgi:hypothetical protein
MKIISIYLFLLIFLFLKRIGNQSDIRVPEKLCYFENGKIYGKSRIPLNEYNKIYYIKADCYSCIEDFLKDQMDLMDIDSLLFIANIPDTTILNFVAEDIKPQIRIYLDIYSEFYFENRKFLLEKNVLIQNERMIYIPQ